MKTIIQLALFLLLPVAAFTQGAAVAFPPVQNPQGSPLPGMRLTFCAAGAITTNGICSPTVTVYHDSALTNPWGSAITTDGLGNFPEIWFVPGTYCFSVSGFPAAPSTTCHPFTAPIITGSSPSFTNITLTGSAFLSATSILCWNGDTGFSRAGVKSLKIGDCAGSSDGTLGLGILNASGLATLSGGVCYKFENLKATLVVSASCGYTTWAAALADCPSTGCILDGTAPDVPLALGAFDTGSNTKPVAVRLGPYSFTATQITVRQGLDFGGAGVLSTNLTSVGTNAQHLFVIPQVNNNIITVKIHDMSINGLSGNTSQDGMFFDCSTLTNAGVQYSRFDNLILLGFNGSSYHFKATLDGASGSVGCFQGNTFNNVQGTRPTGATGATQNALRIEGGAGQIEFWNCWFLGTTNDTGTNVFVGSSSTQAPYSIHFHGTTNQNGFAYIFDGGNSNTTENDHFEAIKGVYNLATTGGLFVGLNFKTPFINSNVGVNAGNGYIINIPNTVSNGDVTLDSPMMGAAPDNLVKNLGTNAASVRVLNVRTFNSASPVNVWVSSGVTCTLTPAATLDVKACTSVQLTSSTTSIATLKSTLMPGERITFYTTGGAAQFATGGNLSLGSQTSPFILQTIDSATFMRVDAGTPAFILMAYSNRNTAVVDLTAQTAAIGTTTLLATTAAGAGQYLLTWNAKVTTAAGVSSTLGALTIVYTDPDGVAQTLTAGAFGLGGAVATTNAANNTTAVLIGVPYLLNVKAGTAVTYAMAYASNAASAMNYNLHIRLEQR